MRIVDLREYPGLHEQAALMLVAAFREHWPEAWPELEEARAEVAEALGEERLALAAVEEAEGEELLLGWIGGMPAYSCVWELHPLAVRPERQREGIGSALVWALEARVRERGARTLMLGSDDEDGLTSLSGVDLYPNPLEHLVRLEDRKPGHPWSFYRRLGFSVIGVVPDANGPGKPDILMAKAIGG